MSKGCCKAFVVARCCPEKSWPESLEEAKANAMLIAAAPRYYDATNEALNLIDDIIPALLFVCANCPLGRKCKDCNIGKTMKETSEFQTKLEILQKEARGEK